MNWLALKPNFCLANTAGNLVAKRLRVLMFVTAEVVCEGTKATRSSVMHSMSWEWVAFGEGEIVRGTWGEVAFVQVPQK